MSEKQTSAERAAKRIDDFTRRANGVGIDMGVTVTFVLAAIEEALPNYQRLRLRVVAALTELEKQEGGRQ